uniref:DUF7595 domain-containing protein n=1 Tax=Setaria viridis TaxID=4556 RepID=A0A4U6TFX8_SETVI|nr:hypothetical protein SEVIR_8G045000v2 [Setaria viridis]
MSSPRKRCRGAFTASPPPPEATTTPASAPALPSDLVLEVVARSDVATLLRCAASCKPLRRDILNPAFIRRVCRGPGAAVPPHLLCFLQSPKWFFSLAVSRASPPTPFALAHPATPAAAYLSEKHLAPFVSRGGGGGGAGLLARYEPVTSRRASSSVKVLTVSSPDAGGGGGGGGGEWSPVTSAATHRRSHCSLLHADCSAVVLGGAVHWVMYGTGYHLHVLTYDVRTATAGSVELPMDRFPKSYREGNDANLRLAASPDGKLTVLVRDRLTISFWRLLSTGAAAFWTLHSVIDTEATLRSLAPELPQS